MVSTWTTQWLTGQFERIPQGKPKLHFDPEGSLNYVSHCGFAVPQHTSTTNGFSTRQDCYGPVACVPYDIIVMERVEDHLNNLASLDAFVVLTSSFEPTNVLRLQGGHVLGAYCV